MSTPPIEGLSNLTLGSSMSTNAPATQEQQIEDQQRILERRRLLERRKIDVRDIASSFEQDLLPSELRPEIFSAIDESNWADRVTQSEWTIASDFAGTVLQWAVHDDTTFQAMERWQRPEMRALLFNQKIKRRLNQELDAYDQLSQAYRQGRHEELTSSEAIRKEVRTTAERIRELVNEVSTDRSLRRVGSNDAGRAEALVDFLRRICDRQYLEDVRGVTTRTTRSSGDHTEYGLLHVLLWRDSAEWGLVVLDLLQDMTRTADLSEYQDSLSKLYQLLGNLKAPNAFRHRLRSLLDHIVMPSTEVPAERSTTVQPGTSLEEQESPIVPAPPETGEPSGDRRGRQSTKRPAPNESATRSGRKRGR